MSLLSQVARTMADDHWSVERAAEVLQSFSDANAMYDDGDKSKISIEEINKLIIDAKDESDIRDALFRPSTSYNGCVGSETRYATTSVDILDSDMANSLHLFLDGNIEDLKTILMEQLQRTEPEYYRYLNPTAEESAARSAAAVIREESAREVEKRQREERDVTGTTHVRSDGSVVQK